MKVFISSDMEGTAGITDWQQCTGDGPEAAAGRRLLLAEVNAAIEGAIAAGASEILPNGVVNHVVVTAAQFVDHLHDRTGACARRRGRRPSRRNRMQPKSPSRRVTATAGMAAACCHRVVNHGNERQTRCPRLLTSNRGNGQPLTQRPANASTAKDRTSAESRISAGLASVRRRHRRMAILLAAGR